LRRSEGCADSSEELPKADGVLSTLWLLFEFPESSRAAFIVGIISVITAVVLLRSSALLCPTFHYFIYNLFCTSAVYRQRTYFYVISVLISVLGLYFILRFVCLHFLSCLCIAMLSLVLVAFRYLILNLLLMFIGIFLYCI